MKSGIQSVGTVGGISTAIFALFKCCSNCCNRKKFSTYVKQEREEIAKRKALKKAGPPPFVLSEPEIIESSEQVQDFASNDEEEDLEVDATHALNLDSQIELKKTYFDVLE